MPVREVDGAGDEGGKQESGDNVNIEKAARCEPYYPPHEALTDKKRKVVLYKSILAHIVGIVTALAELHIGEKVNLRE